jgi:hypothetical protein
MGTLLTDGWSIDEMPTQTMDLSTLSALRTKQTASTIGKIGLFTAVMGGINQAIGTYYQAKSAQYQAKSQASTMRFQSDMALINARSEENTAQGIMEAGQKQIGQYTMAAGAAKAGAKTAMAARGIALGEGNARDVEASMDIVKSIDTLTINANTVRAAEAQRMQATNYKNQSLLDRTSAKNADMSANSISPMAGAFTSLLGSATNVASQWYYRNRRGMNQMLDY